MTTPSHRELEAKIIEMINTADMEYLEIMICRPQADFAEALAWELFNTGFLSKFAYDAVLSAFLWDKDGLYRLLERRVNGEILTIKDIDLPMTLDITDLGDEIPGGASGDFPLVLRGLTHVVHAVEWVWEKIISYWKRLKNLV